MAIYQVTTYLRRFYNINVVIWNIEVWTYKMMFPHSHKYSRSCFTILFQNWFVKQD